MISKSGKFMWNWTTVRLVGEQNQSKTEPTWPYSVQFSVLYNYGFQFRFYSARLCSGQKQEKYT